MIGFPGELSRRRRALLGVILAASALGLLLPAGAGAFVLNGNPSWPGDPSVITYHAGLKGNGDMWAMKTAAKAWSSSEPAVRFKRVKRKQAALVVHYGKRGCGSGFSSVNFPPFRGETVIGKCKGATNKYRQVQLIVHELGHIIGLDHDNGTCATMNEHTSFIKGSPVTAHPFKCPSPKPGFWRCRLLNEDDLLGAVRLYGGEVGRLGPQTCRAKK